MEKLIEEHYLSACKQNPEYANKYTKEEMSNWWHSLLNKRPEKDVKEFILGSIHANNNGYRYHPV